MTTLLQRLLKYPHAAVFDKSPHPELVMRVQHPDGFVWSVADQVLSVTAGEFQHDYDLTECTVGELAAALQDDGFQVDALSSTFTGLSAVVLVEGSGDQAQSNGNKLKGFTNLLYSFLGAFGRELRPAGAQIDNGLRQMVITTAEGSWLDLWGALYDTPRSSGEEDPDYAERIPEEAFRLRVNALAIEKAIFDLTGKDVRLEEPWGELFRLDESALSGKDKFYNGSVFGYHLLRPVSRTAIDWTDVLMVIERNRAAGVIILPPEARLGFLVDASQGHEVYFGATDLISGYTQVWAGARLDYMRLSDYEESSRNYRVSAVAALFSTYTEYGGPEYGSVSITDVSGLTWRSAESPWEEFPWGESMLARTLVLPPRATTFGGAAVQLDVDLTVYDDAEPLPGAGDGFATGGIALFDTGDAYGSTFISVIQQDDGKLVCAAQRAGVTTLMEAVRFNTDGSLDADFGTSGIANVDFGSGLAVARSVIQQADNKIVVCGGNDPWPAMARFNSDGSVDTDFGTSGMIMPTIGSGGGGAFHSAAQQSDGKLVAAGEAGFVGGLRFFVTRFNSDGTADSVFGAGGVVTSDLFTDGGSGCVGVIIQLDGKIVMAATAYAGSDAILTVYRFNDDGSPDTGFGTAGVAQVNIGAGAYGRKIIRQSDGKLVVAGDSGGQMLLVRFNDDGSLDTGFSGSGIANYTINDGSVGYSVVEQADGKLVVAGLSTSGADTWVTMLRVGTDGTVDSTFGTSGVVTTAGGTYSGGNDIIRQSDNKLVVAGYQGQSTPPDLSLLARYSASGVLDA